MPKPQTAALHQAVSAVLAGLASPLPFQPRPAPHSATSRHNAPHPNPSFCQTNPTPPAQPRSTWPLSHRQLLALQFLAAGHTLTATAAALRLHRYTLTRWLKNPLFQAHLERRLAGPIHLHVTSATKRHTAPQSATPQPHILPNKPTPARPPSPHRPIPPSLPSARPTPDYT
jgi:hypothetical protein